MLRSMLRADQERMRQEDLAKRKRRLLDEWEERERDWERHRDDEVRWLRSRESHLRAQEIRLVEAEALLAEREKEADEHHVRKEAATEEQRLRMTELLEQRLRIEIEQELTPLLREDKEVELAPVVAERVRHNLRSDFDAMCAAMRNEVSDARGRMRAELVRVLEPQIEAMLLPKVTARVEQQVQDSTLAALRTASEDAQRLRAELQGAVEDRDRARAAAEQAAADHQRTATALAASIEAERRVVERVQADLDEVRRERREIAEERRKYPALDTDVAALPGAWMRAQQQLEALRREKSRLAAGAELAQQEIAALRVRTAHLPPPQPRSPQPTPHPSASALHPSAPRPSSALHPSAPHPSSAQQPPASAPAPAASPSNSATASHSPHPTTPAREIAAPDRFRYTPSRDPEVPTYPLGKEDAHKVFYREMELLRERTEEGASRRQHQDGARRRSASRTTRAQTPRRSAGAVAMTPPSSRTPRRRAM